MEPHWVMQSALTNAATVVPLAAVVLIVGRSLRRPALVHLLWVLILIKFITPPLVGVPVPAEWVPKRFTGFAQTYLVGGESQSPQPQFALPSPQTASTQVSPPDETTPRPDRSVLEPMPAQSYQPRSSLDVTGVLAMLWIAGTCVYFLSVAVRLFHFSWRLRTSVDGTADAGLRVHQIGRSLGLKRIPAVKFVTQPCSPMLWGLGRFTRIVFPEALWRQLSPPSREALLTHELAHYRRRDHWVRPLEILVTGLFWWHPLVWLARREIEAAEEECCDSWVVRHSSVPPRTYAEALLATVDYIASDSPIAVPGTTGIGGAPDLQQRLRQIMSCEGAAVLSKSSRRLLCAGALLLPMHPFISHPVQATSSVSPADRRTVLAVSTPPPGTVRPLAPTTNDHSPPESWATPEGWWTGLPQHRWAAAESADGSFRLLAAAGNRVVLEDQRNGRESDLIGDQITSVAFAPDSSHFVTGSVDGSVRLWFADDGEAASDFGRHDAEVACVAVSPSGRFAASGSRDGSLVIWDLASGVALSTWTDSSRPIVSVRIASDGRTLAAASGDWRSGRESRITLLTLDSQSIQPSASLSLADPVAAIEFTDNENALLAASWDGTVVRWDPTAGTTAPVGHLDRATVNAATFSPDIRFAERIRPPAPQPEPATDDRLLPNRTPFGNAPFGDSGAFSPTFPVLTPDGKNGT
mgnify:CR=1 FL=1